MSSAPTSGPSFRTYSAADAVIAAWDAAFLPPPRRVPHSRHIGEPSRSERSASRSRRPPESPSGRASSTSDREHATPRPHPRRPGIPGYESVEDEVASGGSGGSGGPAGSDPPRAFRVSRRPFERAARGVSSRSSDAVRHELGDWRWMTRALPRPPRDGPTRDGSGWARGGCATQ